jgi:hypothetical protein
LDGIQDRKKIEEYYKKYDDEFSMKNEVTLKFRKIIDTISQIMGDTLPSSSFSGKPLFYSLFGVIKDLQQENKLRKSDYPKVFSALEDIDSILISKPDELSRENFKFYDAATKHVTDLSRRQIRHHFIKKHILQKIG